jgi:hypothetical protein
MYFFKYIYGQYFMYRNPSRTTEFMFTQFYCGIPGHMNFFLTMTNMHTSQNIDLSPWIILISQHSSVINILLSLLHAVRVKTASAQGWQPCHLHVLIVMKSGSLNLLEPSGPVMGLLYLYLIIVMYKGFCRHETQCSAHHISIFY